MSPPAREPSLDASGIVQALNRRGVRYIVIGAFAAIAQQAPIPATRDIDLTPDASSDNLVRLSAALKDLGARIRTDAAPEGLPFDHDGSPLGRTATWNLFCPYGEFDICFRPSGFANGYRQLTRRAHRVRVEGVELSVADLDDIIISKETAGRPKDLQVLPLLYRHRTSRAATDEHNP
jgi:hypothetical protein